MNAIEIAEHIRTGRLEYSRHALRRVVERNISEAEIIEASLSLEIIEEYPDDKYAPSCLLLGFSKTQRPLHIQICYTGPITVKIITIYEPSPDEWIDNKVRRLS
jgi:hypothetical protein